MKSSLLTGSLNKRIGFTPKGLNLFEMDSKISKDVEADLTTIDISTFEGILECSSVRNAYTTKQGYSYKKLNVANYKFDGLSEQETFNLLLAVSNKGEVKAISVTFNKYSGLKEVLHKIYGQHDAEAETSYSIDSNGVAYNSLYWTLGDFNIRLSGKEVHFYFSEPLKDLEKQLPEGHN